MGARKMVGEKGTAEMGVHAHLEGPSGFITGGVRSNFQFLPRLWTGPEKTNRGAAHADLSVLSGSGESEAA